MKISIQDDSADEPYTTDNTYDDMNLEYHYDCYK